MSVELGFLQPFCGFCLICALVWAQGSGWQHRRRGERCSVRRGLPGVTVSPASHFDREKPYPAVTDSQDYARIVDLRRVSTTTFCPSGFSTLAQLRGSS